MNTQLYVYIIVISISFALSLFLFFKSNTPLFLKGFTPFLFVSLVNEMITTIMISKNMSTIGVYNISTTLEIAFYLWVLLNILDGLVIKKLVSMLIITYPLLSIIDIFFIQDSGNFHSISYAFGCLLIVFLTIVFFYQLFAQPRAVILVKESSFWICTGLLMFYSVSFPMFALANLMKNFPAILANNLQYILLVLNVFLYLLFSIAFLCRIKIKKS